MINSVEEAVWVEKKSGLSPVWIIPIVALLVGAWLTYKAFDEKGLTINIVFPSATGIVAEKTSIKYKDIEIGKVINVNFTKDLKSVVVTAELKKNMKPYLSEKSRFWIMSARVGLNSVEGLDTLLSGAYIVMDPKRGEKYLRSFKGLKNAPVISDETDGKIFKLKADSIGSLDIGSPIYYKRLKAGNIISYKLADDSHSIDMEIFIKKPYSNLIDTKTRFWNASGVNASIGADGVKIHTESIASILTGGLSFDNFKKFGNGKSVENNHLFILYNSREKARKRHYSRELHFYVYLNGNIRGLSIGAPVELKGVKIGEVVDFSLVGDIDKIEFKIPTLIKVEPERFTIIGKNITKGNKVNSNVFEKLIENGLRVELKNGNLLTGELFIDLDFHTDAPYHPKLEKLNGFYILPTVPTAMESLKSDVLTLLNRLAAVPIEEIGREIKASVSELKTLIKDVRTKTVPMLNSTLDSTDSTIKNMDSTILSAKKNYLDSNARINKELIKVLNELGMTTRSIRSLTNYLERHPEAIIRGK